MNPKIDFQLVEAIPDYRATGRNCGEDIPVGTVFTALYRRDFSIGPPGGEVTSPKPAFVSVVSLRLDTVEWFGRCIDHVPSGHAARLTLSGDGFDAVSDAPQHTYYSLSASDESVPNSRDA